METWFWNPVLGLSLSVLLLGVPGPLWARTPDSTSGDQMRTEGVPTRAPNDALGSAHTLSAGTNIPHTRSAHTHAAANFDTERTQTLTQSRSWPATEEVTNPRTDPLTFTPSVATTEASSSSTDWADLPNPDQVSDVFPALIARFWTVTDEDRLPRHRTDTTVPLQDATDLLSSSVSDSTYASTTISRAGERTLLSVTSSSNNRTWSVLTEDSSSHQPSSTSGIPSRSAETEDYTDSTLSTRADGKDTTAQHLTPNTKEMFSETESSGVSSGTRTLIAQTNVTQHHHSSTPEVTSILMPPLRVTQPSTEQSEVSRSSTPPVTSLVGDISNTTETVRGSDSNFWTSTESSSGVHSSTTQSQEDTRGVSSQTREETTELALTTAPPTASNTTSDFPTASKTTSDLNDTETDRRMLSTEVFLTTPPVTVTQRSQITENKTSKEIGSTAPAPASTPTPSLRATTSYQPASTDGTDNSTDSGTDSGTDNSTDGTDSGTDDSTDSSTDGTNSSTDSSTDGTDSGTNGSTDSSTDGTDSGTNGSTDSSTDGTDSGTNSSTDSGTDSSTDSTNSSTDSSTDGTDSGTNGSTDSSTDGTDSGTNSSTDSGTDSGTNSSTDSSTDGTDSGTNSSTDSGTESGTNGSTDSSTDCTDSGTNSSTDSGTESGTNGSTDSSTDCTDSGTNSSTDSGTDGTDSSTDSGTNGSTDSSTDGTDSSTDSSPTPNLPSQSTIPNTTPSTTAFTPSQQTSTAARTQHATPSATQASSAGTAIPPRVATPQPETSTASLGITTAHDTAAAATTTAYRSTAPTRRTTTPQTTGKQTDRASTELAVTTAPTEIRPTVPPPPIRNPCASNPCMNGGMCASSEGRPLTCHCQRAWTGPTCSQDVDECETDPCPPGSHCVNTRGSFSCECPLGFDLEDGRTCTRAKTFLGTFSVDRMPRDPVIFKSATIHELQREIIQLLNASLSVLRGYSRSTLSKKEEDGVRIAAVNTFSISTNVTSVEVYNSIQMSLSNCSASVSHCRMVLHHRLTYHVESLCAAQKTQCDTERSTCTDLSGTAYCQCLQGYYKHNADDLSCLECGDGYKLENGTCVQCMFGFGGFNCGNFYKLIAVVVSPTGGALLLILVIALIVTCCKKDKNDINKIIFKSGDLQMSPYADFPKNNRISMEWGRETIEMQENGSTKNLLQMTDIYYSPALRNSDLERNGLYPFSGLPGSRHSCIYPAQWNPSFISDDSRRRDYF